MTKSKFESLKAWQEAHKLVLMIYKISNTFPKDEKFRLVNQLCRSASSIAANLVEGNARAYRKEYTQFAYQSRGSLEETKYHLLLARDLEYLNEEEYNKIMQQADSVGKLINGLISYLRSNIQDRRPTVEDLRPNI
jgi:four helix bundle protein